MAVRLQIRNDTAANWTATNPILATGELAIETDTRKFKIGNGTQNWNSLPYATQGETGPTGDVWKPSVSIDGDLTWSKDSGATAPTQRNVKGPPGDPLTIVSEAQNAQGDTVVTFSDDSTITVKKGLDGDAGYTAGAYISIAAENVLNVVGVLPTTGGTLDDYVEKLVTVSASGGAIDLSSGNTFVHTPSVDPTYAISNAKSGAHSFTLIINMGASLRVLTFPNSVIWQGGKIPDMTTASKTYVLTFLTVDGGTTWLGMSGGEF